MDASESIFQTTYMFIAKLAGLVACVLIIFFVFYKDCHQRQQKAQKMKLVSKGVVNVANAIFVIGICTVFVMISTNFEPLC